MAEMNPERAARLGKVRDFTRRQPPSVLPYELVKSCDNLGGVAALDGSWRILAFGSGFLVEVFPEDGDKETAAVNDLETAVRIVADYDH